MDEAREMALDALNELMLVGRHTEIDDKMAKKICDQLGVPPVKN